MPYPTPPHTYSVFGASDFHSSSFFDVVRTHAPHALSSLTSLTDNVSLNAYSVDGTTVLAVVFAKGVVIAGDRRATAGHLIARSDMRKVFPADAYSAIAISGAAGPATDLAKLFATELEHYEKVEGHTLSLDGRATKLASMVRAHMPLMMRGLVVVPLFAGYDPEEHVARIYEYDAVGGKYLSATFAATGSGSQIAKGTLKRVHRVNVDEADAVATALDALVDAAEGDSATSGPDQLRQIFPLIAVIDDQGYREYVDEDVAAIVSQVFGRRQA